MSYVCILTDEVLESIGIAPECANCGDASWWYRDEKPVVNDKGVKFCTLGCAIEFHRRVSRERRRIDLSTCKACGFDNFDHDVGCPVCPGGSLRYGPPAPPVYGPPHPRWSR